MVCQGLEPGAAGWKVQTNPLSYSGTSLMTLCDDLFPNYDLPNCVSLVRNTKTLPSISNVLVEWSYVLNKFIYETTNTTLKIKTI